MPMNHQPREFSVQVIQLIKAIPVGMVATYGLIAFLAGKPQGARQVGWLLHSSTDKHQLPWHRVLKAGGILSFNKGSIEYMQQKELLEDEGIVFINGRIDLTRYLWNQYSPIN